MEFRTKTTLITATILVALIMIADMAAAAIFQYSNVNTGTVSFSDISENTYLDANSLYGQPVYLPGNQLFFPTTFNASAANGASDITQGDLTMTIKAGESFAIQKIIVSEYGNFHLTGTGTDATSASITSNYTINGISGQIAMAPRNAYALPGDTTGSFNGRLELDFTGMGIREMDFFLSNILSTYSEDGTASQIDKSFLANQAMVEVYTAPVPLPAAIWFLGTGILSLIGLRRKLNQ